MVIKNWSSNLLVKRIQLNKSIRMGVCFMKDISIEERAINLAQYIIDSKDTVRGAAKKFRDFKINCTHGSYNSEWFENWTENS